MTFLLKYSIQTIKKGSWLLLSYTMHRGSLYLDLVATTCDGYRQTYMLKIEDGVGGWERMGRVTDTGRRKM